MLSSISHVQGVWAWRKWRRVTHQTVKYHLRLWEPANDFGDASSLRHRFLALSPLLVGIGSKNINSLFFFFFSQVNFPSVKSSCHSLYCISILHEAHSLSTKGLYTVGKVPLISIHQDTKEPYRLFLWKFFLSFLAEMALPQRRSLVPTLHTWTSPLPCRRSCHDTWHVSWLQSTSQSIYLAITWWISDSAPTWLTRGHLCFTHSCTPMPLPGLNTS